MSQAEGRIFKMILGVKGLKGGGVAERAGLVIWSVALSLTPRLHYANSQLICLLRVGVFKHFIFI